MKWAVWCWPHPSNNSGEPQWFHTNGEVDLFPTKEAAMRSLRYNIVGCKDLVEYFDSGIWIYMVLEWHGES